jgi:hypothetical protein
MTPERTVTPRRAVAFGHLVVNVPVLAIIVLAYVVGRISMGPVAEIFCLFVGVALAWVWWSAMVPRWREWARSRGADEDRTQHIAQVTGLVWPKGSFFEKTEFRPRKRD